jgi:hypothetical protein
VGDTMAQYLWELFADNVLIFIQHDLAHFIRLSPEHKENRYKYVKHKNIEHHVKELLKDIVFQS